jgi:transposase InsO family protein
MRELGEVCSENRVARLMRLATLQARPKRRRRPVDTGLCPEHAIAENLLERRFEASAPNQRQVADVTYIWTAEGWLYLAAVIDLYSRRAVGWLMSSTMTAQLVIDALMMAIWHRGKPVALLHHSDRAASTPAYSCFAHHFWSLTSWQTYSRPQTRVGVSSSCLRNLCCPLVIAAIATATSGNVNRLPPRQGREVPLGRRDGESPVRMMDGGAAPRPYGE